MTIPGLEKTLIYIKNWNTRYNVVRQTSRIHYSILFNNWNFVLTIKCYVHRIYETRNNIHICLCDFFFLNFYMWSHIKMSTEAWEVPDSKKLGVNLSFSKENTDFWWQERKRNLWLIELIYDWNFNIFWAAETVMWHRFIPSGRSFYTYIVFSSAWIKL
jgi:hypothetical protein